MGCGLRGRRPVFRWAGGGVTGGVSGPVDRPDVLFLLFFTDFLNRGRNASDEKGESTFPVRGWVCVLGRVRLVSGLCRIFGIGDPDGNRLHGNGLHPQ